MIKLNDPRITAYLLGELDPSEVEVIEQALKTSPTLAKNVDQMRQTIELLKLALPEDMPGHSVLASENTSNGNTTNDSQNALPQKENKWLAFLWLTACALIVGLVLYLMCQPGIAPVNDAPRTKLSSQSTEDNNVFDPKLSFDPFDMPASQPSAEKTWEEYGLTTQQVENLGQQSPEQSAQESDIIALFPLEAVNRTQRMNASDELHNPDSWQAKAYAPKRVKANSAAGGSADFPERLIVENPVEFVSEKPKSSFGLLPADSSWKVFQRSLKDAGALPSSQTVRVDQYINHFSYSLPKPQTDSAAFSISSQIGYHPWVPGLLLVKIGVRSQDAPEGEIVASNASVEVVFNPDTVKAYRLIGWEKRLTSEQSTPYKPVESAQIAGNSEVVALYELALTDESAATEDKSDVNLFSAVITYRKPKSDSEPQTEALRADLPSSTSLEQTNKAPDFRFAAAVALFAEILQNSEYSGTGNLDTVLQLLQDSVGDDPQKIEFVELTRQVKDAVVKRSGGLKSDDLQSESKP